MEIIFLLSRFERKKTINNFSSMAVTYHIIQTHIILHLDTYKYIPMTNGNEIRQHLTNYSSSSSFFVTIIIIVDCVIVKEFHFSRQLSVLRRFVYVNSLCNQGKRKSNITACRRRLI